MPFLIPPPLRGQFLYPEHGQKQIFFDLLPPHLVHIFNEWPLTRTNRANLLVSIIVLVYNFFWYFFKEDFTLPKMMFDLRKKIYLRKIFAVPKNFLKLKIYCTRHFFKGIFYKLVSRVNWALRNSILGSISRKLLGLKFDEIFS